MLEYVARFYCLVSNVSNIIMIILLYYYIRNSQTRWAPSSSCQLSCSSMGYTNNDIDLV